MYKFPVIRETTPLRRDPAPDTEEKDLKVRIVPQREGGLPMPPSQLDDLRQELEMQGWLDTLMMVMKAAGNDTRLRILYLLWRRGEVRVNDLATILELTTPAISQQLKKLRCSGLVRARRDAQTIYYRLNTEAALVQCLVDFFQEETG